MRRAKTSQYIVIAYATQLYRTRCISVRVELIPKTLKNKTGRIKLERKQQYLYTNYGYVYYTHAPGYIVSA